MTEERKREREKERERGDEGRGWEANDRTKRKFRTVFKTEIESEREIAYNERKREPILKVLFSLRRHSILKVLFSLRRHSILKVLFSLLYSYRHPSSYIVILEEQKFQNIPHRSHTRSLNTFLTVHILNVRSVDTYSDT